LIAEELVTLINTVVYPPAIDPAELAYITEIGAVILDSFVTEIQRAHPASMASASHAQRDYVGRYVTLPVSLTDPGLRACARGAPVSVLIVKFLAALLDEAAERAGQRRDHADGVDLHEDVEDSSAG
jgi:hypothetical protein